MPELDTTTLETMIVTYFKDRSPALLEQVNSYTIDELIRAFENLRKGMLRALKGLTEEQVTFSPDDATYSLSEVITHIIVGQNMTYNAFLDIASSTLPHVDPLPRGAGDGAVKGVGAEELQQRLQKATDELIGILRTTYKEEIHQTVQHPFMGKLSYKGWVFFQLGHDLDHLKQIQVLRRSPFFPGKRATQTI